MQAIVAYPSPALRGPTCKSLLPAGPHEILPHDLTADAPMLPATTQCLPVERWSGSGALSSGHIAAAEVVAEEVPVALVYNGISHAVMLASPDDLEDFALGFSLSEGIVDSRSDIYDIEVVSHGTGVEIRMHLAASAMHRLKASRRMRTGKTGCGLCGIESLQQFDQTCPIVAPGGNVAPAGLHMAMAGLCKLQNLHATTGAAHAAGWASWDGTVQLAREDIGRHNALDKLIGALVRQGVRSDTGFAVVTSRASYEMVHKAARAGMPLLAAVSAPTAMAVRLAETAGLTLAGFVRGHRHVVYSHAYRIAAC